MNQPNPDLRTKCKHGKGLGIGALATILVWATSNAALHIQTKKLETGIAIGFKAIFLLHDLRMKSIKFHLFLANLRNCGHYNRSNSVKSFNTIAKTMSLIRINSRKG